MLFISGVIPEAQTAIQPHGFNLAIEMLFISGWTEHNLNPAEVEMFQSRNRDAFHFRFVRI